MATVRKGVLTQGTQVWIEHGDSAAPTLTKMVCITTISTGEDSYSDIDDTCLEETDTKTSQSGLNTPGDGSLKINTDPKNASHMTLLQLAEKRANVKVFIGWSDGKEEPTLSTNTVTLPTTRTFTTFDASLRPGAPVFDPDSLVNHTIGMKRQSKLIYAFKTTI